jgi:hypothetical protein
LNWHGPLAIDYFFDEEKGIPFYIDASPRLVEPMNAVINNINIPEYLVRLSADKDLPCVTKTEKKKTHMLMMSLMYKAENKASRLDILKEIFFSVFKMKDYRYSTEELLNFRYDKLSLIPLLFVLIQILVNPKKSDRISRGTVENYSLTHETINKIINLYSSDSILSVFLIVQINYLKFMNAVNYYISYIYDKITTIGNTRNYFNRLTISIISGI